jgi:hypothetical protein
MKKLMFEGLTRRPTYEEVAGLVNKPFITSFPDRTAYKLRNSNWLSQLDGDNHSFLEKLHENAKKEHASNSILKDLAKATGSTFSNVRAAAEARPLTYYDIPDDSADAFYDVDSEGEDKLKLEDKQTKPSDLNLRQITHMQDRLSHLSNFITNRRYPVPPVPQVFSIATPDFDKKS